VAVVLVVFLYFQKQFTNTCQIFKSILLLMMIVCIDKMKSIVTATAGNFMNRSLYRAKTAGLVSSLGGWGEINLRL